MREIITSLAWAIQNLTRQEDTVIIFLLLILFIIGMGIAAIHLGHEAAKNMLWGFP